MIDLVLAQTSSPPGGSSIVGFLPLVLIILIFYLLIYRPMRRRQKNLEILVTNLKNGDKVVTNSGIYGTITGLRENTVLLKVADQVKIEIGKSAIASLQVPSKGAPDK